MKKFISILMSAMMMLSNADFIHAENETPDPNGEETVLEMEELDASTLHVEKLGEVTETEEPEEALTPEEMNRMVRVSIVLDDPSTLDQGYSTENIASNTGAVSYRNALRANQDAVTKRIEAVTGSALDVKWNLTLTVNIISANVRYMDIAKIENVDGVKEVILENQYEPQEDSASPNTSNTSSGMVGAVNAWAEGYTGAGTRVAIVDTGIDTTHQSFNASAFDYSIGKLTDAPSLMTSADITKVSSQLNGNGRYVSTKIPYGYNYVDNNTTIDHMSDTEGEHGSHVAGIAAANRYIKSGTSYIDAASSVKAVGMAPDAQLLVMKVFGANGGAYDSDYMAAIEDAIVLGADSVNLSLGSSVQGFTYSDAYQGTMNKLLKAEKLVVTISAGNSYGLTQFLDTDLYIDDVSMHTGGSPGTFINSLGVAAAQNIGTTGTPLNFNGNQPVYYTETSSTGAEMSSISGTYSYVYIDAAGEAADYTAVNKAVSLNGKVVIVNRGAISFYEKGNNAISSKPKALIVANNEAGGAISMGLDDYTGTFPMVSITLADAETIKANSTKKTTGNYTYYTGTVTVSDDVSSAVGTKREDAEVTDFSSWGVPGSLLMKPEITAPGGDIYSVFGTNKTKSGTAGGSAKYELMSGTSMAAPHMAGLAAVMAEYLNENDLRAKNTALAGADTRKISQSLLMSTATPMKNNGAYVSILQQGSGLAEVSRAVDASSLIFMSENDGTLTAKTQAAADGKVKAEFGDDPQRTGVYTYGFTIYNLADQALKFNLKTDLFTQASYTENGEVFMSPGTKALNASVFYAWEGTEGALNDHDVNKDGVTDEADAQAILDVLSGENDGSGWDLAAGEMDGVDGLSSRDAQLLLNYEPESGALADGIVEAYGKRNVTVTIRLSDAQKQELDALYTGGAYVEGFTYVTCADTNSEGVSFAHEHSIPLLGFYGSWTDASMFDNTSYTDTLYHTEKTPYTGNTDTNYMTVKFNGTTNKFSGNPYAVEEEFPTERLAINSSASIERVYYNLYRGAGTTGFAVTKLDDDHNVTSVLGSTVLGNNIEGIWYYQVGGSWQSTSRKSYAAGKTISSYGVKEGDRIRAGFYAIPEYNAMMVSRDLTAEGAGKLNSASFNTVLASNVLGDGAYVGYDFIVDNTAPKIDQASLSGSTITVSASDTVNLAYVAVKSLDGKTVYAESIPASPTCTITFDASDAIAKAAGYVAVFAGDYAGNEAAAALKVNNNSSSDPYTISSISLDQTSLSLYKNNTATLTATILPLTASDHTATFTSSNTSVATVDNNGLVTAVGKGTATITATANGNTSKKATCSVTVTAVNKDLNGIVWDEEGNVFFSSFNSDNPSAYTKLHNTAAGQPLVSAYMASTSTLYAATMDESSQTTEVYSVNRNTYALTDYAPTYYFATDMAIGMSNSSYAAYAGLAQVYGPYLMAGNISKANDNGTDYVLLPYGFLDTTDTLGDGNYLAAIATKSRSSTSAQYYVLDTTGSIWQTTLTMSTSSVDFSTPTKVMDTGISCSFLYQNLYYDGTYLYWTHHDGSTCELIILNPSSKAIYRVGDFGEGVWPVGGLYVNGKVAPAETGEEMEDTSEPAEQITMDPCFIDEADAQVIRERIAAELDAFSESTSAVSAEKDTPVYGSLTAYKNGPADTPDDIGAGETDDAGNVTVTLSESTPVYNGLMKVTYDPSLLELDTVTSSLAYKSVHTDAAKGEITFAYANKEAIPANTELAQIRFKTTCTDASVTAVTEELNESLDLANSYEAEITPTDHNWDTDHPVWTWAEDLSSAQMTLTCKTDSAHTKVLDAVITDAITKEASCESAGIREYTASVTFNGKEYTDIKTQEIPALGHKYGEPTYEWSADNSSVTAKAVCEHDAGHVVTETVKTTAATVDATCEAAGSTTYTATFKNELFSEQTKVVEIPALGHKYGEPTYEWSADNSSVTAKAVCEHDASHVVTETVKTTVKTVDVTCEAAGSTTYTATFTNELFSEQTKTVEIPALGHDWQNPVWTWAEDFSKASVTFTCAHDAAHTRIIDAEITKETDAASCEEPGLVKYTAKAVLDGKEYTDSKEVYVEAVGHDYGEPSYVWSDDHSTVTATAVCKNDAFHVITETVKTTVKTVDATCEAAGSTTYTATFTNELFSEQTKVVEIPALGHKYGEPTYEWSADNSSVTAKAICEHDASHVITETVNTTVKTVDATCETAGSTTYTAAFTNELFSEQTKVVEIPALGHEYGEPVYEWAEDYSTATAKAICKHDESHVITETVKTTVKTVEPTCETAGSKTYTAAFTNKKFYTQTKTIEIPALGHDWQNPVWTWAEDYSSASATFTCAHDASHTKTIEASIEKRSEAASCEEAGLVTYTATVVLDDKQYTDVKEAYVEAVGHAWGAPVWKWSEDHASAEAVFTCERDASHKVTIQAEVTEEITKAAACESEGVKTFTATAVLEGNTYTDVQTEAIPAIGHKYGEPTYEWTADNSSVTAKAVCEHDASHVITETVQTTGKTVDATCEIAGSTTYTATFTNELFSEQNKVVEIPALGHKYGEPTYEWAEDNSSVTAKAICEHDASHVITETVQTTSETIPATEDKDGSTTYIAVFTNELFETQTKVIVIPATGPQTIHVTGVELNKTELTLRVGNSETLIATVLPEDAEDKSVTWSSSDEAIATVDSNGKVTAVADKGIADPSTAVIVAATKDGGYVASCTVTVEDPINAFVRRLYDLCFGRKADTGGFRTWTNALRTKEKTAAQVIIGFFESKEMTQMNLSDAEYVERCYRVMMDRASDAGGKKNWTEALDAGCTKRAVLRGFVGSAEFSKICEEYGIVRGEITVSEWRDQNLGITKFVARCYREVLGRKAEVGGLNNWCKKILTASNKKQAAVDMATNGFFHSPEYLKKNTSNEQYVTTLYKTFLGREADPSGYRNWLNKLKSGASRDSVMLGFSNSAEFAKIMESYGIK
ncbi:MAG: DUF4214 domain-containing protein [Solobacterium sp.]|nr:DUF4214 domain-containing protein [Solobacterium sp.]